MPDRLHLNVGGRPVCNATGRWVVFAEDVYQVTCDACRKTPECFQEEEREYQATVWEPETPEDFAFVRLLEEFQREYGESIGDRKDRLFRIAVTLSHELREFHEEDWPRFVEALEQSRREAWGQWEREWEQRFAESPTDPDE